MRDRKTVNDVKRAFSKMRSAAESLGANTEEWDVFRGFNGYSMKVRMPGDTNPQLHQLSEHAGESARMIQAATLGFEMAHRLSNGNSSGVYKSAMLASHRMQQHRMSCSFCIRHMAGDGDFPRFCEAYRNLATIFRRGMSEAGRPLDKP